MILYGKVKLDCIGSLECQDEKDNGVNQDNYIVMHVVIITIPLINPEQNLLCLYLSWTALFDVIK